MNQNDQFPMKRVIILLILFSTAMGFMESAVVIYLRHIYYPAGFKFPLVPVSDLDGVTELCREFATVIMLVTISVIAGKNPVQRFAFFLLNFAVWDLAYYFFLKIFLGWPQSLFTWDILFLIPLPWIGPVIAPVILSLVMILFCFILMKAPESPLKKIITPINWILLLSGTVITIVSCLLPYLMNNSPVTLTGQVIIDNRILSDLSNFIPHHFYWWVFLLGLAIILTTIILVKRNITNLKLRLT